MKILFIVFLLSVAAGGCDVSSATVATQNTKTMQTAENQKIVENKILRHAKDNFSLDANAVNLKEITSKELPAGAKSFYLEKKNTYGSRYYNYLVYNDELFCSSTDKDFDRFLKATDFLGKKNLTAVEFYNSFQQLTADFGEAMLVNEKMLAKPYDALKPFADQLSAPKLEYKNNGAAFDFFVYDSDARTIRKYAVAVSPDYQVTVNHTDLKTQ